MMIERPIEEVSIDEIVHEQLDELKTFSRYGATTFTTWVFKDEPADLGHMGLITSAISCEDRIMDDMKAAIEEAVKKVFSRHAPRPLPSTN